MRPARELAPQPLDLALQQQRFPLQRLAPAGELGRLMLDARLVGQGRPQLLLQRIVFIAAPRAPFAFSILADPARPRR